MWSAVLRNEFFWRFSSEKKHQDKLIEQAHSFTTKIIKEKKMEFLNSGASRTDISKLSDVYGIRDKKSFLDILLQTTVDGKPLSDSDIREEVDTFIFEVKFTSDVHAVEYSVPERVLPNLIMRYGVELMT